MPCSIGRRGVDAINNVPAEPTGADGRTTMKPGCSTRAPLQRLQPQQKHVDVDHGEVVVGALLVARGDAAELLEAVDQALHPVAPPISGAVEMGLAPRVALARDHRPDVTAAQAAPRGRAAVALVAGRTPRPQPGPGPASTG